MKKFKLVIASAVACKFCGSPYNFGFKTGDTEEISVTVRVTCAVCGASGPTAQNKAEAVKAWEHTAPAIPLSIADTPDEFRDDDESYLAAAAQFYDSHR